jgi:hypothetical protein
MPCVLIENVVTDAAHRGGVARDGRKPNAENPTMLRFNVDDVAHAAAALERRGVRAEVTVFA